MGGLNIEVSLYIKLVPHQLQSEKVEIIGDLRSFEFHRMHLLFV